MVLIEIKSKNFYPILLYRLHNIFSCTADRNNCSNVRTQLVKCVRLKNHLVIIDVQKKGNVQLRNYKISTICMSRSASNFRLPRIAVNRSYR